MSIFQIAAVVLLCAVAAVTYIAPMVKQCLLATRVQAAAQKPSSMDQVQTVLAIRDSTEDKEVICACNSLLHVLLKVTA